MEITGRSWIESEPFAGGTSHFWAIDPTSGQKLEPPFVEADKPTVEKACLSVKGAAEAFAESTVESRAQLLERIAEEIEALGGDLIERCKQETALPEGRLEGERARTVNQIRMFADLVREGSWVRARIDTAQPDRRPIPKPDMRRMLRPIGPVAVFGASNFPLAFSVAGGDTASALAAGNPVVVKGHPAHPGTSEAVARAVCRALEAGNFPPGVFSLIQGAGHEIGAALVRNIYIRAVGFTGSLKGGRSLFSEAASRPDPIPVYAEMGSVNPLFILPGALKKSAEEIAQGLHQSVTLGTGQFCTNPGLVIVQENEALERFKDQLANLTRKWLPAAMLYSGICTAFREDSRDIENLPEVCLLAESDAEEMQVNHAKARVFSVKAKDFIRIPTLSDEVFGPSTLIVECTDSEEMRAVAQGLAGQLTASIHATEGEMANASDLIRLLEDRVGRLLFNGFPTGVEVCPSVQHGGPYPATTDSHFTSVGTAAIERWVRPVCYQNFPQKSLPPELQDSNPRNIWRLVNGEWTQRKI